MLYLSDELPFPSFLVNPQSAVFHGDPCPCGEQADEADLLGILADVYESPGTGKARPKLADVHVSFSIRLGHTEKCNVETASIIEIKLVGLVDDRIAIDAGPKIQSPIGSPPINPDSAVRVEYSRTLSSWATWETPSGMPMPRFTTLFGFSSKAARLTIICAGSFPWEGLPAWAPLFRS